MVEKIITAAFALRQEDIDIIDQHNQALANPGRSAALRHIIREWASSMPIRVPKVGKIRDEKVVLDDPQLDRR